MPTDSAILADLLKNFQPAGDTLLRWLCERVDDDLLSVIAAEDYGQAYEEHFAALKQIRDTLVIPVPVRGIPMEVLSLTTHFTFDVAGWAPPVPLYRGHLMRTFACTVLLISQVADPNNLYIVGENETLAQLIDSLQVLDQAAVPLALQLLIWRMLTISESDSDRPFFALGILLLATTSKMVDGTTLKALADWVTSVEATVRASTAVLEPRAPVTKLWLLGVTYFKQRTKVWQAAARQILLNPPTPHPAEAAEALRLIGSALTDETI